jgi:hypothetical protein
MRELVFASCGKALEEAPAKLVADGVIAHLLTPMVALLGAQVADVPVPSRRWTTERGARAAATREKKKLAIQSGATPDAARSLGDELASVLLQAPVAFSRAEPTPWEAAPADDTTADLGPCGLPPKLPASYGDVDSVPIKKTPLQHVFCDDRQIPAKLIAEAAVTQRWAEAFESLRPREMLDCSVVNAVCKSMVSTRHNVKFLRSSVYWLAEARRDDEWLGFLQDPKIEFAVAPYACNQHWVLWIFDCQNKQAYCMDSLRHAGHFLHIPRLRIITKRLWGEKYSTDPIRVCNTIQKPASNDCGVFVLKNLAQFLKLDSQHIDRLWVGRHLAHLLSTAKDFTSRCMLVRAEPITEVIESEILEQEIPCA